MDCNVGLKVEEKRRTNILGYVELKANEGYEATINRPK